MKLKQSFRYQLADYKAGILVYYCAMLGLLVLFLVSTVVDTGVTVVFSGLSGFSCIFLFICGLCSLHDNLPMHLQHGVSRRTMFQARLLVTAAGEIPAPDTFDLEADRDLVAAHDGIVVSVNAMAGTARVKPGDCVTAGQVLIAGEERLSAEETGGVCALGEVVARTWSEGTAQAELYVEKRTYTGRSSAASALELFGWSIPLSQGATFAQMEETVLSLPIVGMFLPLRVLRAERMEYTVSREKADLQNLKEEIAQIAWENAISGLPEGCVIVDKWIEYSMIGEDGIEARAVVEAQSNIAITREALAAGMAD